jgi:2-deoxy-D-gluconate 3-dehydrogenase
MKDLFDVRGKVALVTGGRRGLGLALAQGLAEAGVRLAVVARSPDCPELRAGVERAGGELLYLQKDLADRGQRAGIVDAVVGRFGRLDILVNAAGLQHRQPAAEFDLDRWDELISVMLTGAFELSQQAARVMARQGGGKIIHIASLLSFQGGLTIPAYAAAKHGIAGLTQALANEWAARNINVNAIAPGYFDTDMVAAIMSDPVREPRIRERIPAGRWGRPEELVGALLFLASEASAYVHGHVLVVDGGWMGR